MACPFFLLTLRGAVAEDARFAVLSSSTSSLSPLRRLSAASFAILLVVAILWQCDRALRSGERLAAPASAAKLTDATGRDPAPVFVLFLDSLRWETAMDPTLMPALARLRQEAMWAKMNTVYQAHTVPALRAMFTGGMPSGVFNVVTDFRRSNLRLESLFSALQADGRRSASWSTGQFNQFGDAISHEYVRPFVPLPGEHDSYLTRDRRRVEEGLERFAEGHHAMIVSHVEFTDYAGHQFGTGNDRYRAYFAAADVLVAEAMARVPATATLVVIGDHGHDVRGEHKAGLDIPTAAFFRGPAFKPGTNIGTIEITEVGYFFHAALRLPLNRARYAHAALDRGLRPGGEPPDSHLAEARTSPRPLAWATLAAAVVLAVGAWLLWMAPAVTNHALAWGALILFALPGAAAAGGALILALAAVFLSAHTRLSPWRLIGLLALAGALVAFGAQFVHAVGAPPLNPWIMRAALVLVAVAMGLRPREERVRWFIVLAGAALWLADPWQHAAGWLAATSFLGLGVAWLTLSDTRRAPGSAVAVAALALAFASFYHRDAVGHWAFDIPVSFKHTVTLGVAAGIAKFLLFRAVSPARRAGAVAALLCGGLLSLLAWQVDQSAFNWHPRAASTALVILFGGAWIVARVAKASEWSPLLALSALTALFYHGVRAQPFNYAWADLLFFGYFLAGRLATMSAARTALAVGGVALAYLMAQGWLPGGVEWQALYDWTPAEVVESHVGWFLPWILFRETLPFWIARFLFLRATGESWPATDAARGTVAWMLGLGLIVAGHFTARPSIEATQLPAEQLAGLSVLLLVALIGRRASASRDATTPFPSAATSH